MTMDNITYINAGAGSGKTYTLTHHLSKALVEDGIKPSEIILTTFTDAAASEFREKARAVLLKEGKTELAAEMGSAAIGTVHSVCQRFVRKFWYDLGLSPEMNVMSEDDRKFYINQSIADVVSEEDLNFFEEFTRDFEVSRFEDNASNIDFDFWKRYIEQVISAMAAYDIKDLSSSVEKSCSQVKAIFSYSNNSFPNLDEFIRRLNTFKTGVKTWDELRSNLSRKKYLIYDTVLFNAIYADKYNAFFNHRDNADIDRDILVHEIGNRILSTANGDRICKCIEKIFDNASKWRAEYVKYKQDHHLLDFDDMEQYFLRLLTEPQYEEQRKEIATYRLVMVDEFQDSNPVQIRIFEALAGIIRPYGGRCEWVGDPKQSVYGFRGSDTDLITEVTAKVVQGKPLGTSFRSRPELVHLVNDIFTRAFEGIVDDGMIRLENQDRSGEELKGKAPFIHWHCNGNKDIYVKALAWKVKELLDSGLQVCDKKETGETMGKERSVKAGDIAILCRSGVDVQRTVSAMRALDIPVSATTPDLLDWAETQLVIDILRYISDPDMPEVRASLVHLLENMPTESLILERLGVVRAEEFDRDDDAWLKDKGLFKALDRIAARVGSSDIQDMISTIILELGLKDVVSRWSSGNARLQNLSMLESLAGDYEDHCRQLRLTPTISGFITWISDQKFSKGSRDNSSDTVKVMTYHKSKGLEWKVVILESLNNDFANDASIAKKEFTSVKPLKDKDNGYFIHFIPALSGKSELPDVLLNDIIGTEIFQEIRRRQIAEEKRIMYVGITRARDYLITTSNTGRGDKTTLRTLAHCDIGEENFTLEADNRATFWKVNGESYAADYCEIAPKSEGEEEAPSVAESSEWKAIETDSRHPLIVSPSRVNATDEMMDRVTAEVVASFGYLNHAIKDETGCGTCIHNIYAAYRPGETEWNRCMAEGLVKAAGLEKQITDIDGVIRTEDRLFTHLEKTYGKSVKILRETPFTLVLDKAQADQIGLQEGQVVRGEIDLVWMLEDGACVLVDYKSYPHFDRDINAPEVREHYAGYTPQLTLYTYALQSAGYRVTDRLIYYPLQGRIIRIN